MANSRILNDGINAYVLSARPYSSTGEDDEAFLGAATPQEVTLTPVEEAEATEAEAKAEAEFFLSDAGLEDDESVTGDEDDAGDEDDDVESAGEDDAAAPEEDDS